MNASRWCGRCCRLRAIRSQCGWHGGAGSSCAKIDAGAGAGRDGGEPAPLEDCNKRRAFAGPHRQSQSTVSVLLLRICGSVARDYAGPWVVLVMKTGPSGDG